MAISRDESSGLAPRLAGGAKTVAIAVVVGGLLGTQATAQLSQFSGANCSMTSCDCNCISAEQGKAVTAVDSLRVDLLSSLTQTSGRMPPAEALTRLWKLGKNIAQVRYLLEQAEEDPIGAVTVTEIRDGISKAAAGLGLPAPPPGWGWSDRYLESLQNAIRSELARVTPFAERQTVIEKELNSCRQWADLKKCDPSLGTGATMPPATPSRVQPPAQPPAATPPRQMWPPDQPQPFARHPDGRPIVDDDLLVRYIAARRAQVAGESAYWRQGGFGQADLADVHQRVDAWARSVGTPAVHELFDQAELDAFEYREKEVRQALTGQW